MTRLEQDRPGEWLRQLSEETDGYRCLVAETGGLACAAYRLARARCRAQSGLGQTPTLRELQAAALTLGEQLGILDTLPITSLLASDCEEHGLPVILPMPTPPSARRSSIPSLKRAS